MALTTLYGFLIFFSFILPPNTHSLSGKSRYFWICSAFVGVNLRPKAMEGCAHHEGDQHDLGWSAPLS
jgi:hypothetical protein